MLLETLDTKINDVVIYSQNIFSFEKNFKIIYKDAQLKKPHSISYYEVCNFLSNPSPKVIIVYRLLTNLANFSLRRSQYGFPIFLDNQPDLVFFDPVFAVKELEGLAGVIEIQKLRFRIQQIGLNSLVKKGDRPAFTEIYSFDLSSKEAITQNDKIFADAIFALDKNFIDSEDAEIIQHIPKQAPVAAPENNIKIDQEYQNKDFKKFVPVTEPYEAEPPGKTQQEIQPDIVERKTGFGSFLEKNKPSSTAQYKGTKIPDEKHSMIQIFKSTRQLNEYVHGRNEDPVILKFNK